MASMLYHNSQQEIDKINGSEKQLSSDLIALMKLRNRRIRRKQPIGPLKNWPTANAELYLKCQDYLGGPSISIEGHDISSELIRTVEELEYNETEYAKAEAADALKHEVHDFGRSQKTGNKASKMRATARFGR